MKIILLDSNVYDKLNNDDDGRKFVSKLIRSKYIKVVAPQIVLDELKNSPFKGIPEFFPIEVIPDGVAVAGLAIAGAAIVSEGKVFSKHLGDSNNSKDAVIAETAMCFSDVFCSEDKRCRQRLNEISETTQCFDYKQFTEKGDATLFLRLLSSEVRPSGEISRLCLR